MLREMLFPRKGTEIKILGSILLFRSTSEPLIDSYRKFGAGHGIQDHFRFFSAGTEIKSFVGRPARNSKKGAIFPWILTWNI